MKTTLAQQCREHGIAIGDVIDLMNLPESKVSREYCGDEPTTLQGCLVEVTAIGDTRILGYWLQGESHNGGQRYQDHIWARTGKEVIFSGATAMRKIGLRDASDYVWLLPDLINVYTRCQVGVDG